MWESEQKSMEEWMEWGERMKKKDKRDIKKRKE